MTMTRATVLCLAALACGAPAVADAALTPARLHSAYSLRTKAPKPQKIAVVVAYHAPTVVRDLATFSRRYKLPACTVRSGCFTVRNQRGEAKPPASDATGGNWVAEAALGTQTARAVCQNCRILLVEADSDAKEDLSAAVDAAVRLGATEVATSFVPVEGFGDAKYAASYDHPGVAITAASGDNGLMLSGGPFPAVMPGVVAVGGTRLTLTKRGRYRSERVWSEGGFSAGSGCSELFAAPSWQGPFAPKIGCGSKRAVADIAAAASPGMSIYTRTPVGGDKGWLELGGTSFASPLIAGVFALAGGVPAGTTAASVLYRHAGDGGRFHDVTSGASAGCSGAPICRAVRGYDGPTGLGTPRGIRGFRR